MDTAGCDSIHLVPGVRGTSVGRDGEEKMAPWAPRLMLMSGSLALHRAEDIGSALKGGVNVCQR